MFRRLSLNSALRSAKPHFQLRKFSSPKVETVTPQNESVVRRVFNILKRDSAAIAKIFGAYLVLVLAIYNYQIKVSWEEVESKKNAAEEKLSNIEKNFTDDEWINGIVTKVMQSKNKSQDLKNEIISKLELSKVVAEKNTKQEELDQFELELQASQAAKEEPKMI